MRNDGSSITEAMYIPPLGKTAITIDTADILNNEFEFFSYCDKFITHLGTIFTPSLKDDLDIQPYQPSKWSFCYDETCIMQ